MSFYDILKAASLAGGEAPAPEPPTPPTPEPEPYCVSTANSIIQTGFTPGRSGVRYEITYADYENNTTAWCTIYGGYNASWNARCGGLTSSTSSYSGNLVLSIGSGEALTAGEIPKSGKHTVIVEITGAGVGVSVDGENIYGASFSGSLNAECSLGGGAFKIYRFKIYNGGELVKDYVPIEFAGKGGFHELVNDALCYSTGSDDFVYAVEE